MILQTARIYGKNWYKNVYNLKNKLNTVDPNNMTPMQALSLIQDLKDTLGDDSDE